MQIAAHGGDGGLQGLRLELFSDAVFAVAITLLVLDLPLQPVSGSLVAALADRWPSFVAFGISFVLVGCFWISHWRLFKRLGEPTTALVVSNLGLLMCIVLVPFGTAALATYVTKGSDQSQVAAALYAAVMVLTGASFGVLRTLVLQTTHAPAPDSRPPLWRRLKPMTGFAVHLAAIGVAFVRPVAVLAMTGAVAIFYVVNEFSSDTV